MAKKKTPAISPELRAVLKSDSVSAEQLADAVAQGLFVFCEQLEANDVDPEIINAILFSVFFERMQEIGDRQGFEELIEEALELEWAAHTLH